MRQPLAALAALICLISACHDRSERVVHAVLPAARGLKQGALVRYRGIEVGQVNAVRIVDSGVQVALVIERADAPLRTADQVRVATGGSFGDNEVEIVPGSVKTPKLAPNGWLAAYPIDTLASIREAVAAEYVRQAFAQFTTRDSVSPAAKHADSLRPSAARPRR
jgi:hypothetical protein